MGRRLEVEKFCSIGWLTFPLRVTFPLKKEVKGGLFWMEEVGFQVGEGQACGDSLPWRNAKFWGIC